jgi:hypothetical protein
LYKARVSPPSGNLIQKGRDDAAPGLMHVYIKECDV